MSTNITRNRETSSNSSNTNRRGWENPSHNRLTPVGEWEADVFVKSRGRDVAVLRRKVMTKGIRKIDMPVALDRVVDYLRKGYEVRFVSEKYGEAIRLYPCLDANYSEMFVAAQTMGEFRSSLADIRFHMIRRGEEVDPADQRIEKVERQNEITANRASVTPDVMVTCPKCGFEFRVGKSNKE